MGELTNRNSSQQGVAASAAPVAGTQAATGSHTFPQPGPAASHSYSAVASDNAVPQAAAVAISDLLDHGLYVRTGHRVLLVAHVDGLYGGDNLVDRDAIRWIGQALQDRGAIPEVLWLDGQMRIFEWEFPEAIRAAMERNDRAIFHTFDLEVEEVLEFRKFLAEYKKTPSAPGINTTVVRNFATTAPLLCSAWAQTPQELLSEIRQRAGLRIQECVGQKWEMTEPLGTHLTGVLLPSRVFRYGSRREERTLNPWPEWIVPPIAVGEVSGVFVYDRTLSWWSRYIGIPPFFDKPIQLTIHEGKIVAIDGGAEAEALRRFLKELEGRAGEGVYNFDTLHFGVHPQAHVSPQQCPSPLYRRLVEHCHASCLHVHVGSPKSTPSFPYMVHITGDVLQPTFRIGDTQIHDNGRLAVLDDPAVVAVAERYPGRPGLAPELCRG